jgi:hypothetical protein
MTLPLVYGRFKPLLGWGDYLGWWWVKNNFLGFAYLAKTELENFKNWTQNQIIGSLYVWNLNWNF